MSFKPRYSLLTLLVLTALIAGGVKLWHGPHRITERTPGGDEIEYSYTRDWHNNKTVHGPYVTRSNLNQQYPTIDVCYYRQGVWLNWNYTCFPTHHEDSEDRLMLQSDSPLQPHEWVELHHTVEREKQRAFPPGTKLIIVEGAMNMFTF